MIAYIIIYDLHDEEIEDMRVPNTRIRRAINKRVEFGCSCWAIITDSSAAMFNVGYFLGQQGISGPPNKQGQQIDFKIKP